MTLLTSDVSLIDFEQVNTSWVITLKNILDSDCFLYILYITQMVKWVNFHWNVKNFYWNHFQLVLQIQLKLQAFIGFIHEWGFLISVST